MINKREAFITALIIVIITLSISISLSIIDGLGEILVILASVSLIILLNIIAKKITAYYYDSEIEMGIWEIKKNRKKPFPLGAFLPVISKIILFPLTSFVWMASLIFDVKPRIYRGAKRHGLYTFSEITEYHIGLIAASGIVLNLILAAAGYFLGFPLFARLNIYYAFFNMLPISELDGNKIFFGNLALWSFLASLVLIGMLFALFVI